MDFDKNIKPLIHAFYLLGINPCAPGLKNLNKNSFWPKVPLFVQSVISISLPLYNCIVLNTQDHINQHFGIMESVIINISIVGEAIRGVLVVLQCIAHKSLYFEVMEEFRSLESYFLKELQHRISWEIIRKRYFIKVSIVLGAWFQYFTAYLFKAYVIGRLAPLSLQKRVLQFLSATGMVHFQGITIITFNFFHKKCDDFKHELLFYNFQPFCMPFFTSTYWASSLASWIKWSNGTPLKPLIDTNSLDDWLF